MVVDRCGKLDRIPFGTCIWTTGIRMHPLGEKLAAQLQGQEHWRSLMVDSHLRVKGAPSIFALGDAATIEQARTPLLVPPSIRPTLHAGSHHLKTPHCMGTPFRSEGFQIENTVLQLMLITDATVIRSDGNKTYELGVAENLTCDLRWEFARRWGCGLCVQERVLRHAEELFEQGDANHDGMLSSDELQQLLLLVCARPVWHTCFAPRYPVSFLHHAHKMYQTYNRG